MFLCTKNWMAKSRIIWKWSQKQMQRQSHLKQLRLTENNSNWDFECISKFYLQKIYEESFEGWSIEAKQKPITCGLNTRFIYRFQIIRNNNCNSNTFVTESKRNGKWCINAISGTSYWIVFCWKKMRSSIYVLSTSG